MSFFYNLFIILPIINALIVVFATTRGSGQALALQISKFFAAIFAIFAFAAMSKGDFAPLDILYLVPNIALKFNFNSNQYLSVILGLIWLSTIFYIEEVDEEEFGFSKRDFVIFSSIATGLLNMINFAANPYSVFTIYAISITFAMMVLQKHIVVNHKDRITSFFITSIFFELILVFICLCLLIKFSSYSSSEGFSSWIFGLDGVLSQLILVLIILIVFYNLVNPLIVMIRSRIDFRNLNIFNCFILFFVLAKLLLLRYSCEQLFGSGLFTNYLSGGYFDIIQIFIYFFLMLSVLAMLIIKDVKKLFLAIAYNQTLICAVSILVASYEDQGLVIKIIISFIGSVTILFMILNNIVQFLQRSGHLSMQGAFSSLRLNNLLLCYYFMSTSSLLPPGLFNAIDLIAIASKHGFNSYIFFFVINSVAIILIGVKILFIAIKDSDLEVQDDDDAKKIDFSSQLTLTPLAIAFIIILTNFII